MVQIRFRFGAYLVVGRAHTSTHTRDYMHTCLQAPKVMVNVEW